MFNYRDNLSIIINSTPLQGYNSDAVFYLYNTSIEDNKFYVSHLIFNSKLKVSNYVEVSQMEEDIIQAIQRFEGKPLTKKINLITIIELKVPSPLIPDSQVFSKGNQFQEYIEHKYNLSLIAMIIIVPDVKTYKRFSDSIKALLKDDDMYIVQTRTQAKYYLKQMLKKRG